ncbi:MAG: YkgJ family cysteine cluster protein [Desulfurivibrionaceae bacterium]
MKNNCQTNSFDNLNNPSNVEPKKYTLDSKIQFNCHPGVPCFTACCGGLDIILTPFDILRLRKHLGISADDFLYRFTTPTYIEKTDLPGVKINLDENGRCPFVSEEGCYVYSERPTACRYYPVGMADFHEGGKEGVESEKFFFLVKEPHCKGHEEDTSWTIREWRADQGVDECDEMNKEWMGIVMRRKSFGHQASMSDQGKKMFFMASTDTDKFREFVFKSSFLDTYEIPDETLQEIKEDDIALMQFSFRYLASALFGTEDLKIKDEKVKAKAKELEEERARKEEEAKKTYEELKEIRDNMAAARER